MILGRKHRRQVAELDKDFRWLLSAVAMSPIRFNDDRPGLTTVRRIEAKDTRILVDTYDSIVKRRYGYDPKVGWTSEVLTQIDHDLRPRNYR